MEKLKGQGSTLIKFNEEQFEDWFNQADTNQNGVIDMNEAQAFVRKFMMR